MDKKLLEMVAAFIVSLMVSMPFLYVAFIHWQKAVYLLWLGQVLILTPLLASAIEKK